MVCRFLCTLESPPAVLPLRILVALERVPSGWCALVFGCAPRVLVNNSVLPQNVVSFAGRLPMARFGDHLRFEDLIEPILISRWVDSEMGPEASVSDVEL